MRSAYHGWVRATSARRHLLAVVALAVGWFGPSSHSRVPRLPETEAREYFSRILGRQVGYEILVPPGLQPSSTNRFPVLYWLSDSPTQRVHDLPPQAVHEAVLRGIVPPLFVVYVKYGAEHAYLDAASGLVPAETTLVHELIPSVDHAFRTVPDRRHRAIQGTGRGGFGAFHHALAHTNVFGSAASFFGTFPSTAAITSHPEHRPFFQQTFGSNFERVATNHPAFLAQSRRDRIRDRTGLRLVTARDDRMSAENRSFGEVLQAARLDHEWVELRTPSTEGGVLPDEAATDALEFASTWFGRSRDSDRDGPWIHPPGRLPPRLSHHTLYSEWLERSVGYCLYLPPDRPDRSTNPIPVVYHLHGRDEDETRHLETTGYVDGAVRLGETAGFAWVWLYGGRGSWFMDSANGRVPAQSVLLDEVLPHVESRWNLGGSPRRRAVDGWGMGAYGAVRYAAQARALFGAVLIHNPILPDRESLETKFPDAWVGVFNTDARYLAGTEPFGLLGRHARQLQKQVRFRIVAGERSPSVPDATRLRDHLASLGIPHEFEQVPGLAGTGPDLYPVTGLRDVRFLGHAVNRPAHEP